MSNIVFTSEMPVVLHNLMGDDTAITKAARVSTAEKP